MSLVLQAAPFLRQVVQREQSSSAASTTGSSSSSSSPSQDLSAEQFTLAKEQQMRQRGAEIITANGSYQAQVDNSSSSSSSSSRPAADGEAYRPKVATWGVFPRPANISKEFGGGRTLRPGEVPFSIGLFMS